jgi:hypothetical protein
MNGPLRPFGPLDWLLPRLPGIDSWSLVGTVSPEDRCLSVLREINGSPRLSQANFLRIEPDARKSNPRFRQSFIKKLDANHKAALALGKNHLLIRSESVLCREESLIEVSKATLDACDENLMIDISAMPKRYFFPMLTLALESGRFSNIVVTYTTPERYGDTLAEDPLPWNAFPMFGATPPGGDTEVKLLIAVGYQPLKLEGILDGIRYRETNVELLLPFPSVHPGYIKNWEFILQVRRVLPGLPTSAIKRVATTNTPLAFDRVAAMTNHGRIHSVLAPFGPKPISLAMCLFGIACRQNGIPVEIGYTQPQVYSDEYSTGVATANGRALTNAFCVRLGGRNLYLLDR